MQLPNIGPLEIAIVLVIVLVIFGPKRLPQLGRSLGRGMRELKDGLTSVKVDDDDETKQISKAPEKQSDEQQEPEKQREEQQ